MAIVTKGTELWMVMNTSAGYSVVKIGCPTGITGLGGAKSQIETTCLDSDEQEFLAGFAQPGQMTAELDFDPSVISHQQLWDLNENDTVLTWIVGFSDGTATPTVDSAGTVTYDTARTFIEFDGYIADLPLDFAINSVVKSSMQVQRSGARTAHFKV